MSTIDRRNARSRGFLVGLASVVLVATAACGGVAATPGTTFITPSPGAATDTPAPTPTAVPTPTAIPTPTPTPPPTLGPTPIVSSVTITASAPDGRWTLTFHKPVVSGIAPATATLINNAITAKVNAMIHDYNGSELPIPGSGDGPSTYDGNFTVALASPTLLSLRLTGDEYVSGAAHPSHIAASINFRVPTGAVITLASLFTAVGPALATLSTRSRAQLIALLGASETATINGGTTAVIGNFDKAWVFTLAGLELTFQEYSVAAYAAGYPTIVIPWSQLAANINPSGPAGEFLPV
jgi:hypothetical protein